MNFIAIFVGKTIYFGLRITGRRGAALPGLIVERWFPKFLPTMLVKLSDGVIVITGTNGKTTTTKMLSAIIESRERVLTNPTGSNFTRGIVATIIQNCRWSGGLPYDIAVLELDEAYAAKFVDIFKPRGTLVLNIMRDQLDRFAEIDHTARLITKVVKRTTEFVVLNSDDPRVAAMADKTNAAVYYYGVSPDLRDIFKNDDEHYGPVSGKKNDVNASLDLRKIPASTELPESPRSIFSDINVPMGISPTEKIASESILDSSGENEVLRKSSLATLCDMNEGSVVAQIGSEEVIFSLKAGGTYNAQNAIAACAVAKVLNIDTDAIVKAVSAVKPAFGRGEVIKLGGKKVILQLVKNPAGFRHALISGKAISSAAIIIAINDDYADGRDVSWLWDVNFEGYLTSSIITAGTRAADMTLRLKYDDIKTMIIEPDLRLSLNKGLDRTVKNETLLIYATYTAMLKLRNILSGQTEVYEI